MTTATVKRVRIPTVSDSMLFSSSIIISKIIFFAVGFWEDSN